MYRHRPKRLDQARNAGLANHSIRRLTGHRTEYLSPFVIKPIRTGARPGYLEERLTIDRLTPDEPGMTSKHLGVERFIFNRLMEVQKGLTTTQELLDLNALDKPTSGGPFLKTLNKVRPFPAGNENELISLIRVADDERFQIAPGFAENPRQARSPGQFSTTPDPRVVLDAMLQALGLMVPYASEPSAQDQHPRDDPDRGSIPRQDRDR